MYRIDDKVKLLKDIWDDGCDNHHPPSYLAFAGEILVVRRELNEVTNTIGISHENVLDNCFAVYPKEIESYIESKIDM